jgi:hypothetical protein
VRLGMRTCRLGRLQGLQVMVLAVCARLQGLAGCGVGLQAGPAGGAVGDTRWCRGGSRTCCEVWALIGPGVEAEGAAAAQQGAGLHQPAA